MCSNLLIYVPLKWRCSSKVQMEILDKLRDGQYAEQFVKWEIITKMEVDCSYLSKCLGQSMPHPFSKLQGLPSFELLQHKAFCNPAEGNLLWISLEFSRSKKDRTFRPIPAFFSSNIFFFQILPSLKSHQTFVLQSSLYPHLLQILRNSLAFRFFIQCFKNWVWNKSGQVDDLDLVTLKVFSNLDNSMLQCKRFNSLFMLCTQRKVFLP